MATINPLDIIRKDIKKQFPSLDPVYVNIEGCIPCLSISVGDGGFEIYPSVYFGTDKYGMIGDCMRYTVRMTSHGKESRYESIDWSDLTTLIKECMDSYDYPDWISEIIQYTYEHPSKVGHNYAVFDGTRTRTRIKKTQEGFEVRGEYADESETISVNNLKSVLNLISIFNQV